MGKCIFCNKQTNNEYGYYKSDDINGEREKVSVFACTKCLKKKNATIAFVVSLLFLLTIVRAISDIASGKRQTEFGPLIVSFVLFLSFSALTVYVFNRIKTDKRLSDESAAKKLIKKVKKVNPRMFYPKMSIRN